MSFKCIHCCTITMFIWKSVKILMSYWERHLYSCKKNKSFVFCNADVLSFHFAVCNLFSTYCGITQNIHGKLRAHMPSSNVLFFSFEVFPLSFYICTLNRMPVFFFASSFGIKLYIFVLFLNPPMTSKSLTELILLEQCLLARNWLHILEGMTTF